MERQTLSRPEFIKLLIYGMPGTFKTRFAASAALEPRTSPVLYINASGNPVSIRMYDPQPTVIKLDKLTDLNPIYDWLLAGQPANKMGVLKDLGLTPPYKTFILDSVTEVQRKSFNIQRPVVGIADFPAKVDRQHFYNTLGMMVNIAHDLYDLKINVILTCLESVDRNEVGEVSYYSPLLWGQSNTEVGGYAEAVCRMQTRTQVDLTTRQLLEKEHGTKWSSIAWWKPSAKFQSKDQYFAFGDYTIDPTITKLMDALG